MTEPIAFFDPQKGFHWAKHTKVTAPTIVDVEPLPLYAQRTWVGLTDEEIVTISKETHFASKPVTAFARAIEAKLKEKNA